MSRIPSDLIPVDEFPAVGRIPADLRPIDAPLPDPVSGSRRIVADLPAAPRPRTIAASPQDTPSDLRPVVMPATQPTTAPVTSVNATGRIDRPPTPEEIERLTITGELPGTPAQSPPAPIRPQPVPKPLEARSPFSAGTDPLSLNAPRGVPDVRANPSAMLANPATATSVIDAGQVTGQQIRPQADPGYDPKIPTNVVADTVYDLATGVPRAGAGLAASGLRAAGVYSGQQQLIDAGNQVTENINANIPPSASSQTHPESIRTGIVHGVPQMATDIVASLPAGPAAPAVFAGLGLVRGAGDSYERNLEHGRSLGLSEDEAASRAQTASQLQGAATAVLMGLNPFARLGAGRGFPGAVDQVGRNVVEQFALAGAQGVADKTIQTGAIERRMPTADELEKSAMGSMTEQAPTNLIMAGMSPVMHGERGGRYRPVPQKHVGPPIPVDVRPVPTETATTPPPAPPPAPPPPRPGPVVPGTPVDAPFTRGVVPRGVVPAPVESRAPVPRDVPSLGKPSESGPVWYERSIDEASTRELQLLADRYGIEYGPNEGPVRLREKLREIEDGRREDPRTPEGWSLVDDLRAPSQAVPGTGESPSATPPRKEHWQKTQAEFARDQNTPVVDAVQEKLRRGEPVYVRTQMRATKLVSPDQIRIAKNGDVQTMEGRGRWVTLIETQVDDIGGQSGIKPPEFGSRVRHRTEVLKAIKAGKDVPAEVVAEIPDAQKLVARLAHKRNASPAAPVPELRQSAVSDAPEVNRKPVHEMTADELDAQIETEKGFEDALYRRLFGEEGAKRYKILDRRANSSNPKVADDAQPKLDALLATLSKQQQDELYGINQPKRPDIDQMKEMRRAIDDVRSAADEKEMGRELATAITDIGDKTDPATMAGRELIAYVKIRTATEEIASRGMNEAAVMESAIRASASRFSDPEGAAYMLRRWVKPGEERGSPVPAPPKDSPQLPAAAPSAFSVRRERKPFVKTVKGKPQQDGWIEEPIATFEGREWTVREVNQAVRGGKADEVPVEVLYALGTPRDFDDATRARVKRHADENMAANPSVEEIAKSLSPDGIAPSATSYGSRYISVGDTAQIRIANHHAGVGQTPIVNIVVTDHPTIVREKIAQARQLIAQKKSPEASQELRGAELPATGGLTNAEKPTVAPVTEQTKTSSATAIPPDLAPVSPEAPQTSTEAPPADDSNQFGVGSKWFNVISGGDGRMTQQFATLAEAEAWAQRRVKNPKVKSVVITDSNQNERVLKDPFEGDKTADVAKPKAKEPWEITRAEAEAALHAKLDDAREKGIVEELGADATYNELALASQTSPTLEGIAKNLGITPIPRTRTDRLKAVIERRRQPGTRDNPPTPGTPGTTEGAARPISDTLPETRGSIYRVNVNGQLRYTVRENMESTRGGGDTLHNTVEEAQAYIEWMRKRDEWAKARAATETERADKEARNKAIANDTDGYADKFGPAARQRIINHLNKLIRFNGEAAPLKLHIRELVNKKGYTVQTTGDGERRLVAPDGSWFDEKAISKIGMAYAAHLKPKKAPHVQEEGQAPPEVLAGHGLTGGAKPADVPGDLKAVGESATASRTRKTTKLSESGRAKLQTDIEQAGIATELAYREMVKRDRARGTRGNNKAYEKALQAWREAGQRESSLKAQLRDSTLEDIAESEGDVAPFFARTRLNRDELFDFDGVNYRPKTDEGKAAAAKARELVEPFVDKKIADREAVLDEATRVALNLDPDSYRKDSNRSLEWAAEVAEWPTRQKAILDELEALDFEDKSRVRRKISNLNSASDLPIARQYLDEAKAEAKAEKLRNDQLDKVQAAARVARVSELTNEPLKPSIKHIRGNVVADKESPFIADGTYLIDTSKIKPNGLLKAMRTRGKASRELPADYIGQAYKEAINNATKDLQDHGYITNPDDGQHVRYFTSEDGNQYAVNADVLATLDKAIGGHDSARATSIGKSTPAILLYQGKKPVALISPFGSGKRAEIDVPTARGKSAPLSDLPDEGGRGTSGAPTAQSVFGGKRAREASMEPAPWHTGKNVNAPEILRSFENVLTKGLGPLNIVPTRVGKQSRGYAGHYQYQENVTRIKEANDIPTAAHELGHAVEDAIYGRPTGSPWINPRVDRATQIELARLGRDLYGDKTPNGGYKREGFAEFMRFYLMGNDAHLTERAPKFKAFFDKLLTEHPKFAEQLALSRDGVKAWYDQGAEARAVQSMTRRPVLPRAKWSQADIKAALVDEFAPLESFAKEAADRLGRELQIEEDPYLSASALRMTHSAVLNQWAEHGMTDFAGNATGPGLAEITAATIGKRKEFSQYLWARRALKMWQAGKNPGMSLADAQHLFGKHDSPRFQLAADKFYRWWDGVLDYVAEASPTFAKTVEAIRKGDVGDYIPLMREFEEYGGVNPRTPGGVLGRDPAKRQTGSGRRVLDPFEETLRKADTWIKAAQHRYVLDQVIKLSRSAGGMGHWITEIPKDQLPVKVNAKQMLDQLVEKGLIDPETIALADGGADLASEYLTAFTPAFRPHKKGDVPVAPVWENGKTTWYEFDPKLYNSLAGLDSVQVNKILDWLFVKPASVFRTGTTGLSAGFSLFTNPSRDLPTFLLQTHSHANPAQLLKQWADGMRSAAIDGFTGGNKRNEWVRTFHRLGLEMAQPLGQDTMTNRRAARRLFESSKMRIIDVRNHYDILRGLFQFTDAGPRIAEMKVIAKEIGWKPGTPMTNAQAMALRLAARRVTVDFSAGGWLSKVINRITPYHNAQIQGLRTAVRSFKNRPLRSVLYGIGTLTAATAAAWLMNKDEDWYKDMPPDQKYRHLYFQAGNNLLRVPRPFDWAMPFSIAPEAILDSLYRKDSASAIEAAKQMAGSLVPPMLPTTLDIVGEQLTGREDVVGRPIESAGQQFQPPGERSDTRTSTLAKAIGERIGYSPKRIDAGIGSMFGAVGTDLANLGRFGSSNRAEGDLSAIPVMGRMFRAGGVQGTPSSSVEVDRFYNTKAELEQRGNSRTPESQAERERRLDFGDTADAVKELRNLYNKAKTLAERQQLKQQIVETVRRMNSATSFKYRKPPKAKAAVED